MKVYAHVDIKPKWDNGAFKHYWCIKNKTEDGTFVIQHGYAKDLYEAFVEANIASVKC